MDGWLVGWLTRELGCAGAHRQAVSFEFAQIPRLRAARSARDDTVLLAVDTRLLGGKGHPERAQRVEGSAPAVPWTGSGFHRYDDGALRTVSGKCDADYVIRRHINRYSCKAESVFCRVPFRFARRMPRLAPTNERSSSACLLNEPDIAYSLLPSLRSVIVQRSHRHSSGGLSCLLFSHRC